MSPCIKALKDGHFLSQAGTLELLIHSAEPQSRPIVISVFAHVVRFYVRPQFSKSRKNITNFKRKQFTTGETVGLAKWIIDDTCLVFFFEPSSIERQTVSFVSCLGRNSTKSMNQEDKIHGKMSQVPNETIR